MRGEKPVAKTAKCSFCGKEHDESSLIEGQTGRICTECLTVCNDVSTKKTESKKGTGQKKTNLKKNSVPTKTVEEQIISFSPLELKQQIDEVVIGQEESKRQLIMEFYKHYQLKDSRKNNVFLIGNSGVGKTYLVRNLAKLLNVPFLEIDATSFSETGYKGRDVMDVVDDLIDVSQGYPERIENAIVFIDEIDKLTTTTNGETNNKVQQGFLKLVEGATYPVVLGRGRNAIEYEIDTSKILFIAAGACVGIEEIIKKRQKNQTGTIGFQQEPQKKKSSMDENVTAKDLISFGFIPEFVGRFPLIVQLKDLTDADYRSILMDSKEAIIPEYIALFKKEKINLVFSDDAVEYLVNEVKGNPLGARGIQNTLAKSMNRLLFESLGHAGKDVKVRKDFWEKEARTR